jgi:hypothetical protein
LNTAITITIIIIITTIPVSTSNRLKSLQFHPCRKFFPEKARQGWSPACLIGEEGQNEGKPERKGGLF